jgi:chromosome segregation ATPase
MKRIFFLLMFSLAWSPSRLLAQGNTGIDIALERKANEERFARLNSQVEKLVETQELLLQHNAGLRRDLESLANELRKVKEENQRARANLVPRDEYRTYLEKFTQEIEKKRQEDKDLILKTIKKLEAPVTPPSEPKGSSDQEVFLNTTEVEVSPGVTLLEILNEANKKAKEQGRGLITLDQIKKANLNLNPDRIRVGQKILIPIPPKNSVTSKK